MDGLIALALVKFLSPIADAAKKALTAGEYAVPTGRIVLDIMGGAVKRGADTTATNTAALLNIDALCECLAIAGVTREALAERLTASNQRRLAGEKIDPALESRIAEYRETVKAIAETLPRQEKAGATTVVASVEIVCQSAAIAA